MKNKKTKQVCLSCGSGDWHENRLFGNLPRVTSDCSPFAAGGRIGVCLQCGLIQKVTDAHWRNEIDAIYRNYKMYELTGGADQILFEASGVTRAQKIEEILAAYIPKSFDGHVLDIGCGTGGFLKAFGEKFPNAALFGQEIDDKNLRYLKLIPNFEALYTAAMPVREKTFDVIATIHCFEHLYDYTGYFEEIETISKDGTKILIQVPDVETSPFDIVVADHSAHFSQATLQRCLNRYKKGFAVTRPVYKELTAICGPNAQAVESLTTPSKEECIRTLDMRVDYLIRILSLIDDRRLNGFGVYGTTIAGGWLTAAFGDKIAFYVDDDPLKQGKSFYDKDIIAADQVPGDCKVVMPYGMSTVRKILSNHANLLPLAIYCE